MKKTPDFYKHSICMVAIFILCNLIIGFPRGRGVEQILWAGITVVALGVLMAFLFCKFRTTDIFSISDSGNVLGRVGIALFLVLCLVSFWITCRDYTVLIDKIRLPNTTAVVIALLFNLIVYYMARSDKKVIFMFSFFSLIITIACLAGIFIFSSKNMDIGNLGQVLQFNLKDYFSQVGMLLIYSVGQAIIAAAFINDRFSVKRSKPVYITGILIGTTVFLICALNIITVLGTTLIPRLSYPYSALSETLTFGKSYSRMDGFTYYIYFSTSLIKCSVILKVIMQILNNNKFKNIIIAAVLIISVLLGSFNLSAIFESNLINIVLFTLEVAVLIAFYLYSRKKAMH